MTVRFLNELPRWPDRCGVPPLDTARKSATDGRDDIPTRANARPGRGARARPRAGALATPCTPPSLLAHEPVALGDRFRRAGDRLWRVRLDRGVVGRAAGPRATRVGGRGQLAG